MLTTHRAIAQGAELPAAGQPFFFDQREVRAYHAVAKVPQVEDVYLPLPVRVRWHRVVPLHRTLARASDFPHEAASRVEDLHGVVLSEPVVAEAVAHHVERLLEVSGPDGVSHDEDALEGDAVFAGGLRLEDAPDFGAVGHVRPVDAVWLFGLGAGLEEAMGEEARDRGNDPWCIHALPSPRRVERSRKGDTRALAKYGDAGATRQPGGYARWQLSHPPQ